MVQGSEIEMVLERDETKETLHMTPLGEEEEEEEEEEEKT